MAKSRAATPVARGAPPVARDAGYEHCQARLFAAEEAAEETGYAAAPKQTRSGTREVGEAEAEGPRHAGELAEVKPREVDRGQVKPRQVEAGKVDAHLREVRKHELEELREIHLARASR